ncbi:hypothetical protein [Acetobacter sp.]|uniref:hypothetical protein n=1 Tax=Acetobacter sp. TaxID=440 RepID=UPI0039ECBF72
MRPIRRFPISSTMIVRLIAITVGVFMLLTAAKFVAVLPDVMPGNAAGILAMVTVGAILLLGAIWIGV